MFLSLKVEIINNYSFIETCCNEYTYYLAKSLTKLLEGNKCQISQKLPSRTKEEIRKKAYDNYQRIVKHKAIQHNYLLENCVWFANDFKILSNKKEISLKYGKEYHKVSYRLNYYQKLLMEKMIIYKFLIRKVDDYWVGYLYGVCNQDDYYQLRNSI